MTKNKKLKTDDTVNTHPVSAPESEGDGRESEIQILTDNWKRALADYQNLSKRVENDKKEVMRYVSNSIISKLIPTLDILEMAAHHSQDMGIKMAVTQFQSVLSDEGLQEITPQIGEMFDPKYHEAIEVIPGEQDDSIAEILTKGYKIGDYVIRPSRVKVFKKES